YNHGRIPPLPWAGEAVPAHTLAVDAAELRLEDAWAGLLPLRDDLRPDSEPPRCADQRVLPAGQHSFDIRDPWPQPRPHRPADTLPGGQRREPLYLQHLGIPGRGVHRQPTRLFSVLP